MKIGFYTYENSSIWFIKVDEYNINNYIYEIFIKDNI